MADNSWLIGDNDVADPGTAPVDDMLDTEPEPVKPPEKDPSASQSSPIRQDAGIMALLHTESHDDASMSSHHHADEQQRVDVNEAIYESTKTLQHETVDVSSRQHVESQNHDDAMTRNDGYVDMQGNPWDITDDMPSPSPNTSEHHAYGQSSGNHAVESPIGNPWQLDDNASTHDEGSTPARDDTETRQRNHANAFHHDDSSMRTNQNADMLSHDDTDTPWRQDANNPPYEDASERTPGTLPSTQPEPAPPHPSTPATDDPWVGFAEFSTQLDPWGQTPDNGGKPEDDPNASSATTIWGDTASEPAKTARRDADTTLEEQPVSDPIWGSTPQSDSHEPDMQTTEVLDTWQDDSTANDPWLMAGYSAQTATSMPTEPDDAHTSPMDMSDYADKDDNTNDSNRKPIIITIITVLILTLLAGGGYAGYSMWQSHQRAQIAQQAEQSRKQHEFEAANAYKATQTAARTLIATIKESAYKDDKTLQQEVEQLETQANAEPSSRDIETVTTMTDKLKTATSRVQHAYDQLVTTHVGKLKTRRDTLVKTADGLKDAPAGEWRDKMLKLANTLRNADITADNQTGIGKQCDDLESLIAKNRKAKEDADRKAKAAKEEQERKKASEEAQRQAEQQAQQQQQYTPPQPQYTPQYTPEAPQPQPQPQPQVPQQPSGGGSTFVPDTGGGSDASDM
ncbi:phosphopeptide-binding protein [Bifidobacterium pseudolongum subsp. globosum]|uniref:hypothetical protein n=1 Tax=Bifidobacterium pseudolongum TaxID=1694 RepID=UPI001022343C|nr:hypothetical protein [Bifidobacterium pseudolongum]RYQ48457.1 phosphopeptide-binding protein [Bifidobacterium pseudolongum subsp. globosum]